MPHVVIRSQDGALLAPDQEAIRGCVLAAHRVPAEADLLAFGFVTDHGHLVFAGPRPVVGEAVRRLELRLHHFVQLDACFERARIWQVRDEFHLGAAAPYAKRQPLAHQNRRDRFWEGSSLHELLGLRPDLSRFRERLFGIFPGRDLAWYAEQFEIEPRWLDDWAEPLVALDHEAWIEAVDASLFTRPSRLRAQLERIACVNASPDPAIRRELVERYRIPARSVRRYQAEGTHAEVARLVRRQYRFRAWRREELAKVAKAVNGSGHEGR